MIVKNGCLIYIENSDIIDGVFTAPDNITSIGDNLNCIFNFKKLILPKVITIGDNFLAGNNGIEYVDIPMVTCIGYNFMAYQTEINYLNLPNVKSIGLWFMPYNPNINLITIEILKALGSQLYVGGLQINKNDIMRKLKVSNILSKINEYTR